MATRKIDILLDKMTLLSNEIKTAEHASLKDSTQHLLNSFIAGEGFILRQQDPTAFMNPNAEEDEVFDDEEDLPEDLVAEEGDDEPADEDPDLQPADIELDETFDYSQDFSIVIEGSPTTFLTWLRGLTPQIKAFHAAKKPIGATPGLKAGIEPSDSQLKTVAMLERNNLSPAKGCVDARPPGSGKTLSAIMAILRAKATAVRPSIVVVTSSCLEQWEGEFKKFVADGFLNVLKLDNSATSPLDLLRCDVILMSYNFAMAQYRKEQIFLKKIADIKKSGQAPRKLPTRPMLSIFSDMLWHEDRNRSPYLILDEFAQVKNTLGITHLAVSELRGLTHYCLALSGSPIDNQWYDLLSIFQFYPHYPFDSMDIMYKAFSLPGDKDGVFLAPEGYKALRLIQVLNSFCRRTPELTHDLPSLGYRDICFELTDEELNNSEVAFEEFEGSRKPRRKGVVFSFGKRRVRTRGGRGRRGQSTAAALSAAARGRRIQKWWALTKSQQHTCHPHLVDIMEYVRTGKLTSDDDGAFADALPSTAEDCHKLLQWRELMATGDKWKSSRIMAIIGEFNRVRDGDPQATFLIFSNSVYFLDLLEIALTNMDDPVECLRFDGRSNTEKRHKVLAEFEQANGSKVLLASRGAGGVGLNITTANVVFLCEPWWKDAWEEQAVKRAWRIGQTRQVTAVKFWAKCQVDQYIMTVRDTKSQHNNPIVRAITKEDDEDPHFFENLV